MREKLAVLVLLFGALHSGGVATAASDHSAFPVDIRSGPIPVPVQAAGHVNLLYELHITNFYDKPVELKSVAVGADRSDSPIKTFDGAALVQRLGIVGVTQDAATAAAAIPAGGSAILFADLELAAGAVVPRSLHHRFTFSVTDKSGARIERSFDGIQVPVSSQQAVTVHAPLSGANWVAFNALGAPDHRRTLLAVDGQEHLAQRFAIDWQQLAPNGLPNKGKGTSNTQFYCYGRPVLAVAHATVESVEDSLPEYNGTSTQAQRDISLKNIAGNYVVLSLGEGRYALYAHLQPHSITVKPGQEVEAGTVLGKLGNSGNSDQPHLHFQVMDGPSPLGSEGLPYTIDAFTQVGVVDAEFQLDQGQPWKPAAGSKPVPMARSFPANQAVVSFP